MKKYAVLSLLSMLLLFAVAVVISAVALVALPDPLEAGGKVTVCHKPGTSSGQTIEIDEADLADHLGHGDQEGQCAPLQETVVYVCSTSDVEFETLYVSSDAGGAQKGTVERPFGSVSAALQFAEQMDFPGVELQIGPGVYGDDAAALSRPTRLVGPGQNANPTSELSLSIANVAGHELGVQGVVFRAAGSGPAIVVSGPAADTALCDVRFESVVGHALLQTGGTVSIEGGVFNSTARDPEASSDDHLTGTAMVLAGGVSGSISDIHVDGSSGSGLHISGAGTRVDVDWAGSSQSVFENGVGCLGAVVVKDGAELNASHLRLDGNGVRGIDVEGNGAAANLPFLVVTSTQHLVGGEAGTLAACGFNAIFGVRAGSGATVDITGTSSNPFIISDSALAGMVITGIDPPEVSLSHGVISNNPVGVAIVPTGSTPGQAYLDRFSEDGVLWTNNVINLDAPILDEPEPLREWACGNGLDDDGDGLCDCDDPDCESAPDCS